MAETVPTSTPADPKPERPHPPWCTRDEAPGRSHRSRPRVIETDYGQRTTVYLDRTDLWPDRDMPTVLVVEQTMPCFEPDGDHDLHQCQEPQYVGLRMEQARQFIAIAIDLVEGTRDVHP